MEPNQIQPAPQYVPFDQSQALRETTTFFQKIYAWMFLGLTISGVTAYVTATTPSIIKAIVSNQLIFYSLLVGELIIVIGLSALIKKISANLAVFLFLLYCFVTGLTLSIIFLIYTIESIGAVFFITATMFGVMSIYGHFTKKDLSGLGQVMIMGLIGIVLASLVNLFLGNPIVDYVTSIVGVVVFTGLTAYDTQKLRKLNIIGNDGSSENLKEAIIGALTLYLDFINLFLDLLRLMGKRR